MPTLLEPPETEANPFQDLIGGEDGAPAYQVVGGRFGEVPKAEINTPTDYGPFADLVPTTDSVANGSNSVDDFGPFSDLIPASSTSESEKALAETPKPKSALVQAEIDLEKLTGIPVHQVMNSTRVYGNAAGKYIFSGLQGLEIETAKALKNPPSELTTPQAEAVLLPQEQQDALEQKYLAETQPAALDALARAEYFKQRAEGMDEFSEVDPALAHTIPARLAAVAGEATMMGMEALVPGVGLPLMVMHGALATEAEALNHGQTPAQAEAAAVRSAIGLAIFGGTSKVAAVGMAKLIPQGSEKVVKFLAQFFPQTVANETSSRAIAAWNAASDAPQGEKIERAVAAFQETTLEQSALNTAFALIGASKAAGARPKGVTELESQDPAIAARLAQERAVRPASEPQAVPAEEGGIPSETARYIEPARGAEALETRSAIEPGGEGARPNLVHASRNGSEIRLEFDATGRIPATEELRQMFGGDVVIERRAPGIVSGTRGTVNFVLNAVDKSGRMSGALAEKAYRDATGSSEPIQTQSAFQRAGPLSKRFQFGRRVAGDEPIGVKAVPTETVPEYLRRDPTVERLLSEPPVAEPVRPGEFPKKGYTATDSPERVGNDWTQATEEAPTRRPRQYNTSDGGFTEHPLVQFIQGDMGGIMSKSSARKKFGKTKFAQNESVWEDAPVFTDPRHNKVYNKNSGVTPDSIATAAAEIGLLPDGATSRELWAALDQISKSSRRIAKSEWVENAKGREVEVMAKTVQETAEPYQMPSSAPVARSLGGGGTVSTVKLKPGDVVNWNGRERTVDHVAGVVAETRETPNGGTYPYMRIAKPGEKPTLKLDAEHYVVFNDGSHVKVSGRSQVTRYGNTSELRQSSESARSSTEITSKAAEVPRVEETPRLRPGEKQGDIFGSQPEELTLRGEKGIDYGARQRATEKAAAELESARKAQDARQGTLEDHAARLKLKANKEGGFVNADVFQGVVDFGARIYRKGVTYGQWAKEMIRQLGNGIKTHLTTIWDSITGRNMLPNSRQGGALFGGGGKTKPKGTTPKGDTEFIRIEHGVKRMFKGLERHGDADTLGSTKNKVGQLLSAGMRKHTDLAQEIEGQLGAKMEKAQKGMTGKTVDAAFDEIQSYIAAKENGRPLPTLSKKADQIWKSWQDVAVTSGNLATANNVQVLDAATGKYRPGNFTLGEDHIPRVLHPAVEQAMRDPKKHSVLWNDLVDAFAKQRGLSEAEAGNQLRAEASQIRSAAVMGNLEKGRGNPLPEIFYDYDLRRLASGYIPAFSERMAQIIAYGQRLGPREKPQRPNLWDIARGEAENTPTKEWLNSSEDRATNVRPNTPLSKFTNSAQTATSGLYLSSPTTTVQRNIISGFLSTVELAGVRRSLSSVARAFKRAEHGDAREIGAVKRDMGALLHADMLGDSALENAVRGFTRVALKYSGYSPGESWVRTHGFLTSSQFAREGVAAINKRPSSMRSKEALGLFKRMRVDAEKIVAEKGEWETGPETRRFIREFIKATQGGYRFDQVAGFAQSNTGRFLYQFGRWGTQRAQNMARNGIRPMFGETVEWHGKKMSRVDLRPIAKMAVSAVAAGETFGLLASVMFGRDRKDASLSEIREAWKDDEKLAVAMAAERLMNDVIMSGMFGIWGQPFDWAKSYRNQTRFKNPLEPPGLGSIDAAKELVQSAIDQGGEVTKNDLLTFGRKVVPGVIQSSDVARNIFDESLYEAQNDVKTLRAAAQRWAKREGMDVASKSKGGDFRKSELAPDYEPIKEALLVGDAQRAEVLAVKFLNSAPDRAKAAKSLRASVKASQPFRAGPYTSETHHTEFREWARKNLSKADYQQTERIQERYVKSAKKADLW